MESMNLILFVTEFKIIQFFVTYMVRKFEIGQIPSTRVKRFISVSVTRISKHFICDFAHFSNHICRKANHVQIPQYRM